MYWRQDEDWRRRRENEESFTKSFIRKPSLCHLDSMNPTATEYESRKKDLDDDPPVARPILRRKRLLLLPLSTTLASALVQRMGRMALERR